MSSGASDSDLEDIGPRVFASYQLDSRLTVETIFHHLELKGFSCWTEVGVATGTRTAAADATPSVTWTLKDADVLAAYITQTYVRSETFVRNLTGADLARKPIVLVTLFASTWPPEGLPLSLRRILARHKAIDLSSHKLYGQNLRAIGDHLNKRFKPT